MNKLSLKYKLIYSVGNLGIAIITVMHTAFLVYYFFPPGDADIPYVIPQADVLLGITLLGIIMTLGRFFDAVMDPVIASFSDRLQHPKGRRVPMMRWAALPFVVSYLLTFFVPVPDGISYLNAIWLLAFMLSSAFFFTSYMIPFYSLMVEVAKSSDDKVDLGTISSAFWFVGFLLVSFSPGMWDFFAGLLGVSRAWGVKITFVLMGCLGFVCLMVPALLIDELKFADERVERSHEKLLPALRRVLRNRSFSFYLCAITCYSVATAVFEAGLIYFITVLALLEAGVQGPITTIIGVLTLACYPLIAKTAKGLGKSWVLKVSLVLFALSFAVITLLGLGGIHPYVTIGMLVVLSPFAQAGFGILPQVVTSDCAAYDQYKSGEDHAGMYIAANGFFKKVGGTLGVLMFTSFLLLGKDVGNDSGIRFATLFGAVVCVLGYLFLRQYDEQEILSYNRALERQRDTAADAAQ